ncbi:unnamed protein product [Nesidiocoris tenuis]|uniref:Uncharacterized protein n=2 Tax=Nesidiocoris tenuis TaxID=355587 RepID=A0A6H5HJQ2_9HEMI|nr:selenoprotein K [Nesidiocoris tenuis]CAB0018302.1 unnamed protein product [Nesidiocoris tenuis]
MTYVTGDGRICDNKPWGVAKLVGLFWAVIDLIVAFFTTLIPRDQKPSTGAGWRSSGGWSSGGGGGGGGHGGGGGGGSGPRGPPKPPPRRNIYGMGDIRGPPGPPPCASGGCCG